MELSGAGEIGIGLGPGQRYAFGPPKVHVGTLAWKLVNKKNNSSSLTL
jgi:hypothetical protein